MALDPSYCWEDVVKSGTIIPGRMSHEQMLSGLKGGEDMVGYREWLELPEDYPDEKLLPKLLKLNRRQKTFSTFLDKNMIPIVSDLLDAGYLTSESCQGGRRRHKTLGHMFDRGYITICDESISSSADLSRIRAIIKGRTNTPFRIYKGYVNPDEIEDGVVEPDYGPGLYTVLFSKPVRIIRRGR